MKATYGRFHKRHDLPTWDEGYGPTWLYLETMGPVGVVRAQTWEEAWECVLDEILHDATPEQIAEADANPDELPEGMHYRGGEPSNPDRHSLYATVDLNGDLLIPVDSEVGDNWGVLVWDLD